MVCESVRDPRRRERGRRADGRDGVRRGRRRPRARARRGRRPARRRRRRSRASRSPASSRRSPTPAARWSSTSPSPRRPVTTVPWLAMHGIHAVVGTTGLGDDDLAAFASDVRRRAARNCVVAANFAISAVLMMRFAELAAPFFDTAEIIELHHDRKIDAPSGTAAGDRRADGRRVVATWAPDPTDARGRCRAPAAAPGRPGSASTPCACAGWSPTRRSSSGPPARRSRSARTATTGPASCPACCWRASGWRPPRPHRRPRTAARPLTAPTVQRRRFCPQAGTCRPHETHRLRGLSIHRLDPS